MSPRPSHEEPNGHWVDGDTGEMTEHDPRVGWLEQQLEGAEREIRAWRARYAKLVEDKDAKAQEHPLYPRVKEMFKYWRKACRHPRSGFKTEHFEMALPYFEDKEHYGEEMIRRAIAGAAFDPFITQMKNGKSERHDHWSLIFKTSKTFERFCNKAPHGWEADGQGKLDVPENLE